jgi:hypothetical protein
VWWISGLLIAFTGMTKFILCAVLMTGCYARPHVVASPQQKLEAISLYMNGATSEDIGAHYGLDHDETRELLRMTIRELNKKFYSGR